MYYTVTQLEIRYCYDNTYAFPVYDKVFQLLFASSNT